MVSQEFLEQFLWTPCADDPTSLESNTPPEEDSIHQPDFQFTPGVFSELESLASLAFSNVEKIGSTGLNPRIVEGASLVISCPQRQGAHIIDAAVRRVAKNQGADVLVLDALELAYGRFGLLGPEGGAIDKWYIASQSKPETGDDNEQSRFSYSTLQFIDSLLSIPPRRKRGLQPFSNARRRIIYMRDFQLIEEIAEPLIACILKSLYLGCGWNYPPDPYNMNRPEPTILTVLVFGVNDDDARLFMNNERSRCQEDALFLSTLFTHVWDCVAWKTMRSCYCTECKPGGGNRVELTPIACDPGLGEMVKAFAKRSLRTRVFAANVKAGATREEWQKAAKDNMVKRVNQVMFRACLENIECPLYDRSTEVVSLELTSPTPIITVHDATRIVHITKGLIVAEMRANESLEPFSSYFRKADDISRRCSQERADWERNFTPPNVVPLGEDDKDSDSDSDPAPPSGDKGLLKGLSFHAKSLKHCIVDISSIPTTFGDVFVDPATIESLQTIVTLPLLFPSYFNCGVLAKEAIGGILLYGPPGTGKTMLCRALAKSSHARMLHIQASDINDKWAGEAEKNVAAVFELAYRLSPCIVFIDEIDSLFSVRTDDTKRWERSVLTEFMQCMDGLRSAQKNRDSNIVVVGATNRPYDLDPAILRRMPRRILVDLPNFEMRKGILKSYLENEVLDDDVNAEKLAEDTKGFSGSDLKNLCVAAALASVKQAIGPQWKDRVFSTRADTTITAEGSTVVGGAEEDLPTRKITASNIRQAQLEISKSITANREERLYQWHNAHSNSAMEGGSQVDSSDDSTA